MAERAFLRALQGGCQVPIGATTTLTEEETGGSSEKLQRMKLYGIVLSVDGKNYVQASGEVSMKRNETVPVSQVEELGIHLAENVREQGADALLGRGGPRPITYSEVATN
jgi:hydroxymethylbilane synthase